MKCTAFEGSVEQMLRSSEAESFSWSLVEFVLDRLDGVIGERPQIAALGQVLA